MNNIKLTKDELTELLNVSDGFIDLGDDNINFLCATIEGNKIVMQDTYGFEKTYAFEDAEVDDEGNLFLSRADMFTTTSEGMKVPYRNLFSVLKFIRADSVVKI